MAQPSWNTGPFKEFCKRSSIKGLAKATNTPRRGLRLLWCVAVFVGAAMALYIVIDSLKEYLSYPIRTVTRIEHKHTPFPDVTVCNLQGLKSSKIQKFQNSSYKNIQELFENDYKEISSLGFRAEDLILECEWSSRKEDGTNKEKCTDFRQLLHPKYFNCYTIHYEPEDKQADEIHMLGLMLYTDDFIETVIENETFDWNAPMEKGMILVVHPSGTYPDMSEGIYLTPGYSVRIDIDRHQRVLQQSLGSNCTDQKYLNMSMFTSSSSKLSSEKGHSAQYTYSKTGCNLFCMQETTIRKCGCISRRYPSFESLRSTYEFCGSDGFFKKHLGKTLNNRRDYHTELDANCTSNYNECSCQPPCEEMSFRYSIHQAVWPHEAYHKLLYNSVNKTRHPDIADIFGIRLNSFSFLNVSFTEMFNLPQNLSEKLSLCIKILSDEMCTTKEQKSNIENLLSSKLNSFIRGNVSFMVTNNILKELSETFTIIKKLSDDFGKTKEQKLFRRNFLKVQIRYASQYFTITTDERAYTINTFMGSLGGVLNLWIGISLVTLFELLELCYRLIMKDDESNIVQVVPASNVQIK